MQRSKTVFKIDHISVKKKSSQSRKKRISSSTMNKSKRRMRGKNLKISGR